jgi:hypothetical protein
MYQAVNIMKTLNVIGVIVAVTIIALAGIAMVAATAAASLLVQSASATTDVMTTTTTTSVGREEQEAVSSTTTNTTNNASNALLGRLFSYDEGEDVESNVNPVNETYIVISYSGNRIILPPNGTSVINATETGNVTINIQPNGLSFNQGHAVIMTEGDAEEGGENATISFVLLIRANPDGSGSGTGVTYFSTNSTGQLAFLDNLVAIGQVDYSPAEGINSFREWEWKGGTLPFETGGGASITGNQTTANNNVSNAALGNPFMIVDFQTASVNPINETYIEISTVHNVTIIPPNATATGTTINGTETANTTVNILPNGLALDKGQSLIVIEGEDDGTAEQENATTTFVDISRMNPDGTGSGTGVVFFSTNSTGQLAFLDNMVGINDSEFSQGGGTIRVWEWKGGTLPFEIGGGGAPTTGNQTTTISPVR